MIASCRERMSFIFKMMMVLSLDIDGRTKITLTPMQIINMMTRLQSASHIYQETGGLHMLYKR